MCCSAWKLPIVRPESLPGLRVLDREPDGCAQRALRVRAQANQGEREPLVIGPGVELADRLARKRSRRAAQRARQIGRAEILAVAVEAHADQASSRVVEREGIVRVAQPPADRHPELADRREAGQIGAEQQSVASGAGTDLLERRRIGSRDAQ